MARVKRKRIRNFKEKFAIDEHSGSFKLTAWGCFQRHMTPRREQDMSREESAKREFSYGMSKEERREQRALKEIKPGMSLNKIMEILNEGELR